MAEQRKNIMLKGYDDLISSEESRKEEQKEKVQEIPLSELYPFKDHPFRVVEDEAMLRTVESVSQYGVIVPAIARPREDGGYELISGHRRKRAAELAGLTTLPVIAQKEGDDRCHEAHVIHTGTRREAEHDDGDGRIVTSVSFPVYRKKTDCYDEHDVLRTRPFKGGR